MSEQQDLDPQFFEYIPGFLPNREADRVFEQLWDGLEWSQREITLFGRRVLQPRLVAWYGDPEATYRYSGLTLDPLPWHPLLRRLKNRVEESSGYRFNSVLANAYRDGSDSMGWHSDDEKELGPEPVIASVTLGAPRRFLLRPRKRGAGRPSASIALPLEHGSLLLMKGKSQQRFQHSLPRTRRKVGLRINLTYRLVCTQAPVWR
jgi:alkylated DNA repair dioxygenase AlkB